MSASRKLAKRHDCVRQRLARLSSRRPIARKRDVVNHPPHYTSTGIEVIDVIEAFGLNFRLGNSTKYILRAGRKGSKAKRIEDLKKALWYLAREIAKSEGHRR